jgi:hypothetical protein
LLHFNAEIITNILIAVFFSLLLFLFIYSNYKIFTFAKSKREEGRVAPTTGTTMDEKRKKQFLKVKNISTCPQIIASALRLASKTSLYDRQVLLLNLWSNTFISLNSTFNCVIFFWRNSILRREGMKIVNAFRRRVTNWIAMNNLSRYCRKFALYWFFEDKNRFIRYTALAWTCCYV